MEKRELWTPEKPILELPYKLRKNFAGHAHSLHYELRTNRLTVVLVPAPEPKHIGHCIRVAVSHNPEWYSQFYWENPHFRRDRALGALDRIRNLNDGHHNPNSKNYQFKYDWLFRDFIKYLLCKGYEESGCEVPPDENALEYFNRENLEKKLAT